MSTSPPIPSPTFTRSFPSADSKAAQIGSFRLLDRPLPSSGRIRQRRCSVKPLNAEPKRNDSVVPLAATIAAPEGAEKIEVEDYDKLAEDLQNASPLEIMDKALEKFGNHIAIAFSGAEDVVLIEYTLASLVDPSEYG